MSEHFDLVVIGAGPAGEKGAAQAAYFGKRVCIIERAPKPGGAAVNTGTIPSKTLRETALYFSGIRQRGLYGVDLRVKHDITVADFMQRERSVVETEWELIDENLKRHDIESIQGTAHLVDDHTVEIERYGEPTRQVTGDVILIATGSHPQRPERIRDRRLRGRRQRLVAHGAAHPRPHDRDRRRRDRLRVCLHLRRPRRAGHHRQRAVAPARPPRRRGERSAAPADHRAPRHLGPRRHHRHRRDPSGRLRRRHAGRRHAPCPPTACCSAPAATATVEDLGLDALGIRTNARGYVQVDDHYHTGVGPHLRRRRRHRVSRPWPRRPWSRPGWPSAMRSISSTSSAWRRCSRTACGPFPRSPPWASPRSRSGSRRSRTRSAARRTGSIRAVSSSATSTDS